MTNIAIKVENLSKSFLLGHNKINPEPYTSLRDVISKNAKNMVRKTSDMLQGKVVIQGDEIEEFWALKDINFEIKHGQRVGIIGSNGAGKSTLLKILSRITEPTTGRVKINGRVASLLEVGTGFHPELSGRENIFLNGAILGMSRRDIQRKFDEIVEFAEVERFLDTPVKRYSSGMYVRLAFAVAAHLEPEILVVDEVLAVGDAKFQKKCLGKMKSVSRDGRTVIFVSHDMSAVINLCNSGILLNSGAVKFIGTAAETVNNYFSVVEQLPHIEFNNFSGNRRGNRSFVKIDSLSISDKTGRPITVLGMGESFVVFLKLNFSIVKKDSIFGVILRNSSGQLIHDFRSSFDGFYPEFNLGLNTIKVTIPSLKVYPGEYTIGAWVQERVGIPSDDYISEALRISVIDKKLIGDSGSCFDQITKEGTEVYHPCRWTFVAG
jgi:lipopolysaccharide transport system ATP-binding protein